MNVRQAASGVVGAVILLVAFALLLSEVHRTATEEAPANIFRTVNPTFDDLSGWTVENTGSCSVSAGGTACVTTSDGSGTASLSQDLEVDYGLGVQSAVLKFSYSVSSTDNLVDENIVVYLNGQSVWSTNTSTAVSWTSQELDVSQYVTGSGTYTLRLYVEAEVSGTVDSVTEFDNVQLTVDTRSLGEKLSEQESQRYPRIFNLLILVIIVGVIVLVLRQIGAL